MLGGTWVTDRQVRTVFALGFEIEAVGQDVFAVVAILLSGERALIDTAGSADEARAKIADIARKLEAIIV